METSFHSKALEANLAQTRYKDIFIPEHDKDFIALSVAYYGINKRASECVTEFHHPLSNHTFVVEELRQILVSDFWFYVRDEVPIDALEVPLSMMRRLLVPSTDEKLRLMIINTLMEFTSLVLTKSPRHEAYVSDVMDILFDAFQSNSYCFILSSKYMFQYLTAAAHSDRYANKARALVEMILKENYSYWRETTTVESWVQTNASLLTAEEAADITKTVGAAYFDSLEMRLQSAETWEALQELPRFDQVALHFSTSDMVFPHFITRFHYVFYLLHLQGMVSMRERLIWNLDKMVREAVDELTQDHLTDFIDTIFDMAEDLREEYASAVMDIQLTLGLKIIDVDQTERKEIVNHFEKKLISFGFVTPGKVFVGEDWQLFVDENHIKNIRTWLRLIEHSQSLMEKLLSALIVNLKLGGIFISDTDLFQREITKILNSNIAPYYKKVKQLTRIFPVYFNEIGAEGEIRKVTTNMDEISGRQDRLIHFLRKQVHTESNNTLIGLTLNVFKFWNDGIKENLRQSLPDNVYENIDMQGTWYCHVHNMVQDMCLNAQKNPDDLLQMPRDDFERYVEAAGQRLGIENALFEREHSRLMDIRDLYAYLKEKYSFESVNICNLLRAYPFIADADIDEFERAFYAEDFRKSLTMIYSFMEKLKDIIFNPQESESWENIYHKRHIAIGIPSMYGVYRENKFEALGLTFRLERVATQLMERVVENINLDYISERTLEQIMEILEYFREGLELDGITNQSFNSQLAMLRYSLTSRSFSFAQYINIFQFIAEDVRRIIIKHFLKSFEYPLKVVVPQIFDPNATLDERSLLTLISKKSEEFHRDLISDAFLVQPLDNFIARIIQSLRAMQSSLDPMLLSDIMTYNSEMLISPFNVRTPKLDNQVFIGSKAYHLKNLFLAGLPVPPGFVITTEVFRRNATINAIPEIRAEIHGMIRQSIVNLEALTSLSFGDARRPLLLSVRSGTAISMPGAMDTFLNVGLNDDLVEEISQDSSRSWAIWDSYRRLIQSWGMAKGIHRDIFDEQIKAFKRKHNVAQKIELEAPEMRELAMLYKNVLVDHQVPLEQDLFKQVIDCINMVIDSWDSERAYAYRNHLGIAENWGTAVIVQQMIFGNLSENSGTGVVFTQNPQRERPGVHLYGDFTMRSQGEDIVGGLVKPLPIGETQRKAANIDGLSMQTAYPAIYKRIYQIATELTENLGYSPQEMEFTFESDKAEDFHILQIRNQDLRLEDETSAFDMSPSDMHQIGQGIGIGGGVLNGVAAFCEDDIKCIREKNPEVKIILIRPDTVPDDIGMIFDSDGLLTARGGATSHAAVTAVRLGKICVVNCTALNVDDLNNSGDLNGFVIKAGDKIALDGNQGVVYAGNYPTVEVAMSRGYNY